MSLEFKIHQKIESLTEKYLKFLCNLIQTPSITGEERICQELVKYQMQDIGIYKKESYASNEPPYWPTGRSYQDRPCIIGSIGQSGPRFVLNAHIDTAPIENLNSWLYHPFSGHIENNRIYGRGALDDKSGVAMMLLLAEVFQKIDIKIPGILIFESVIEDEDSGNGTLACVQDGYFCDAGIIVDGTWPFRIIDAHLGQVWLHFQINGTPKAACSQQKAANPIDNVFNIIQEIKLLIDLMNKEIKYWHNIQQPSFINIGRISAGCWAGATPEKCEFDLQVGFPPPFTPESITTLLVEKVDEILKKKEGFVCQVKKGALGTIPFANKDNKIVNILTKTIRRLNIEEYPLQNIAVSGHCDLRHLRNKHGLLADACLYGPGGGENPHVKNEYYRTDHFIPVAKNIASTILDWFGLL